MNPILKNVTPLILTYNEAPNIARTLQHLTWANEIVVIDSYSSDETLEILYSYPHIQVFQRKFDTHANQWNYGVQKVDTEWVLSLDADYSITDEFVAELGLILKKPKADSYFAKFKYCVFGKPLRGTLLPPREILFKKNKGTYLDDGHTQLLQVNGVSATLTSYIYHDDRKSLSRWLWAQDRYMIIEAQKLLETPKHQLGLSDRIRKQKFIAPFLILFYCLFVHRGILDGWAGWYYAAQRMLAELLLAIHLIKKDNFDRENQEFEIKESL